MGEVQQNRRWARVTSLRVFAFALVLGLIGLGGWLITIHFLAEYHLRQAQRAFDRQRYTEALEHLDKANRLRPRSADIQLRLARAARLTGNFPKAQEHLRQYKELRGQTEEEQLERLMLRAQTGEAEKVYPQLWPYVAKDRAEASQVLEALTYGFIDQQLLAPAQNCMKKWREIDPDNIQRLVCEAMILDRSGMGSVEARENYARALELDPGRADVRLRLAYAFLAQQRDKDAIEQFRQILKQQPGNAPAELGLAQATLNIGKGKEARAMLQDFLEKHPDDPTALREMGKAEMDEQHWKEAAQWLHKALKRNPNDGVAIHSLMTCLRRVGGREQEIPELKERLDKASNDARRLDDLIQNQLLRNPFNADLAYEVGAIYDRLGDEGQAVQWYGRALKYDPNHQKALKAAVKYLEKTGDEDLVKQYRSRIIETRPDPQVLLVAGATAAGLLGSPLGGPLLAAPALVAGVAKE